MLSIPFIQSSFFVVVWNAGKWSTLSDILKAVKDTTDEHALSEGVGERLYEIPTEPLYVVDAVVTDSELQSEEEGGSTEYKTVTLLWTHDELLLDVFNFLNFCLQLDLPQVESVDLLTHDHIVKELKRLVKGLCQVLRC